MSESVTERPIIFSDERVSAILEGRKTQTRRIKYKCEVGDMLWVRECFAYYPDENHVIFRAREGKDLEQAGIDLKGCWKPSIHMPKWAARIWLEVTAVRKERLQDISEKDAKAEGVDVDVYDEIIGEGRIKENPTWIAPFIKLWDLINAKRGYGWDTNPEVHVIEFKIINHKLKDKGRMLSLRQDALATDEQAKKDQGRRTKQGR
jgi:hypothetical protein